MPLNQALQEISYKTLGLIGKTANANAGKYSYNYNDYNRDILPVILPLIKEAGISINFKIDFMVNEGVVIEFITLTVKKGDEEVSSRHLLKNNDIQKRGAEITYLKRYLLVAMFNLPTEQDTDGVIGQKVAYMEQQLQEAPAPATTQQAPATPQEASAQVITPKQVCDFWLNWVLEKNTQKRLGQFIEKFKSSTIDVQSKTCNFSLADLGKATNAMKKMQERE